MQKALFPYALGSHEMTELGVNPFSLLATQLIRVCSTLSKPKTVGYSGQEEPLPKGLRE